MEVIFSHFECELTEYLLLLLLLLFYSHENVSLCNDDLCFAK